jgi:hypothetical protein
MRISNEALFKVVSTRFGLRIVENSIENLCSPNEDFGRPDEPFVDLSECFFEALFNVS